MPLTPAQKLTLRTHIQANTTVLPFAGGSAAINTVFGGASLGSGDAQLIAEHYMLTTTPNYWIVRQNAPFSEIRDAILGDRFTPTPGITGANAAQHTAASNQCMAKLAVLDFYLPPGSSAAFDATRPAQTKALKDSLTSLPSAASFNLQDAGWIPVASSTGVANALVRRCTNLEKVFLTNTSVAALNDGVTTRGGWNAVTGLGNPDITTAFGQTVNGNDISDIHGLSS